MKFFTYNQSAQWDRYVKSFPNWDVYYLCEYAVSFMLHGDGEPFLICYEDVSVRICYVLMKSDIAGCSSFKNYLPFGKYFDFQTPYGYGGPLVDGEFSAKSQRQFVEQLNAFCNKNGIVSQFIRFHPMLENQTLFSNVSENVYIRDTVYIDTSSADIIFANLDSKNRNMVRKAQKAGIQIVSRPIADYEPFFQMYRETLQHHNADHYYYFSEKYFDHLSESLQDNATIFYALLDSKPICGAIFLYNEKTMHYHLAGNHMEYRNLPAGNLLLYEAALWANKKGIVTLHLGGGLTQNDQLFGFKKQFNRNGRLPFFIGRTIFNRPAYDYLLWIRKQLDPEFDIDNDFMIQYRR